VPNTVFHLYRFASVIPTRCAKVEQNSPELALAYLLQLAAIPVCVGPGAITDVVVDFVVVLAGFEVVVVVLPPAGVDAATQ